MKSAWVVSYVKMEWISDVSQTVNISIIRHVINKLKVRGTFQDKIMFTGIAVR
jgi:hypothetical protein